MFRLYNGQSNYILCIEINAVMLHNTPYCLPATVTCGLNQIMLSWHKIHYIILKKNGSTFKHTEYCFYIGGIPTQSQNVILRALHSIDKQQQWRHAAQLQWKCTAYPYGNMALFISFSEQCILYPFGDVVIHRSNMNNSHVKCLTKLIL